MKTKMRNFFIIIGLLAVFSIISSVNIIKRGSEFDDWKIISMDNGENIEHSYYIVVEDEDTVRAVANNIAFDYLSYREKRCSIFDLFKSDSQDAGYIYIDFIDIKTEKNVQSINKSKLGVNLYEIINLSEHYFVSKDGKEYLANIYLKKNRFTGDYKTGYVLYDIEGKGIDYKEEKQGDYSEFENYRSYILGIKENDTQIGLSQLLLEQEEFIATNELKYDLRWSEVGPSEVNGVLLVQKISNLPQNNPALYTEFPYLLEAINNSSMQDCYVILVFPYSMNADEVVRMITEEGHEVSYDGVFVSEDYSIDGQKHYVNNFEEYMQYLKVEE